MGVEIERKFKVQPGWTPPGAGTPMRQGYLALDPARTVRIRRAGDAAWLTIKGLGDGLSRPEFEYPIPAADADALLALCLTILSKTRHRIPVGAHVFEVDVFDGPLAGLILAEVELRAPDEPFERPAWLAEEVTHDPAWYNSALAHPPAAGDPR